MPRLSSRDAAAVYVSEKGYVCIKQENLHEDDSIIMLQPDQVPTIMTWLMTRWSTRRKFSNRLKKRPRRSSTNRTLRKTPGHSH